MKTLNRCLIRLRNLVTGRRGDQRLREELEDYVAREAEANIQAGMSEEEARRQAWMKLGAAEAIREQYHAEEGLPLLECLAQDTRFSLRQMRRSLGFTLVVVLTMALGIAATTTMFTVVYSTMIRSLPYPQSERIVAIHDTRITGQSAGGLMTGPRFYDIAARNRSFYSLAFFYFDESTLVDRITDGEMPPKGGLAREQVDAVRAWVAQTAIAAGASKGTGVSAVTSDVLVAEVEKIARAGGTPLLLAERGRILGCIALRDILKPNMRVRFDRLRAMGIRTVMITGDNPLTAAAIARDAGVDDFLAEATPETKMSLIKREQSEGRLVAMTGDGTNDAPALAQADVGVAMNSGTQAAKEAANMVDLDSDPTKLIEVVEIGKQLLMTRGSLTTFSIANDVAKYFAILPAMFAVAYPAMGALNIMQLASRQSAILSAIIFNALIIIALIPLALRGVPYRPRGANAVLRENVLIYGLGGIIVPFIGIKAIDLILVGLHLTGAQ